MPTAGSGADWLVATPWQVSDLACLATRALVEDQRADCGGVVAALGWVRGSVAGPITGRDEQPVTKELATAEMWAAAASRPGLPAPPLAELCLALRVEHREPRPVEPGFAEGVWTTLRWLIGTGGQRPPLELPARTRDGQVIDADEAYGQLVARRGIVPAEQIGELRAQADRIAARSRLLAAQVAEFRDRVRS